MIEASYEASNLKPEKLENLILKNLQNFKENLELFFSGTLKRVIESIKELTNIRINNKYII